MKATPLRRGISLLLALFMIFGLALGCTGCGGSAGGGTGTGGDTGGGTGTSVSASAASMFLRKTAGTVAVADAAGADVAPAENLGLYSGYTVGTEAESYAWIDLDKVKLAKLDENSAAEITKDGKNLSIDITAGSLFFNVTEPIEDDETMEIRTSSMIVGIRGTCGWVEVPDSGTMRVYILEGKVECTAGENTAAVNAGETAEMTEDGAIGLSAFTALNVPDFVTEEMETDEALSEAVLAASGIDAAGNLQSVYPDVFRWIEYSGAELVFAEEIDFEGDGSPELLVIYTDEEGYASNIYRKATERSERLCGVNLDAPRDGVSGKISLVESGGRLFVCIDRGYDAADGAQGNSYGYWGSTAQNDGDSSCWGRIDYVWRHRLGDHAYTYKRCGLSENGLRENAYEDSDVGEYEAVPAQYTEVRVLVTAEG